MNDKELAVARVAVVAVIGLTLYFSWWKPMKIKERKALGRPSFGNKSECNKKTEAMKFSSKEEREAFMTKCLEDSYSSADCGCGA